MTLGICEVLWLRFLLQDLGFLSNKPIRLYCDNKAVYDIAHNLINMIEQSIWRLTNSSLRRNWMKKL